VSESKKMLYDFQHFEKKVREFLDFLSNFTGKCSTSDQLQRENFVFQMMEDGTIDGIQKIIRQIAIMFLRSVPADQVLEELVKIINEEQGTQSDLTKQMVTLNMELINLEKLISQLQHDHDELKEMKELKTKNSSEKSSDHMNVKHALEEKLSRTKSLKTDKSKKK
jgi:hypothetical protein